MGVNLEWEVCESGGGAGEEWAGATMLSSAELLLPAERGWVFFVLLAGLGRLGAPRWGEEGLEGERELLGEGIASRQFGLIRTHAQGMVVKRRFSML